MRGIILAAGAGTRLGLLTAHQPKCLVSVNGVPIVENALRALHAAECSSVSIVIGCNGDILKQRLGFNYDGTPLDYVVNADWATTNTMFSLHLALERGPARHVIEGDVYFDPVLLRYPTPPDVLWLVDSTHRASGGAYLRRGSDGYVDDLKIVKSPDEIGDEWSKSVGMLMMSDRGASRLRQWLRAAVTQQKQNLYYDLVLAEHLKEGVIQALDIAPARWWEIDTPEDLANAEKVFS